MASAGSDGTCMSWHTGVYSTLQACTHQGFSAIEMETNHEEFYDPIQYEYPAGELDNEPFYNDRVPRQAQQSQRTTQDEAAHFPDTELSEGSGTATDIALRPREHQQYSAGARNEIARTPSRLIRPRYLCFLRNPDDLKDGQGLPYKTMKVSDWIEEHGDIGTEFVFVSYTRMQFRVNTEKEIAEWNYDSQE